MQRARISSSHIASSKSGLRKIGKARWGAGDSGGGSDSEADRSKRSVSRLLAPLSPLERDVLTRRIVKGHSARKVAKDLGVNLAEVRAIQRGALRRLLPHTL